MRKKDLLIVLIFLALYTALVSMLAARHEVWRDEIGVFSIIRESRTPWDMLQNLRNYGHPGLWYIILYLALIVSKSSVILKVTHVIVAVFGALIFLSKSPFKWPAKILFLFGYFPLYAYSVISRNYGISMPLLFLFCAFYHARWKRPILLSILLGLLANTNAHSLLIALCACLSLCAEYLFIRKKSPTSLPSQSRLLSALGILTSAVFISFWQIIPDKTITCTELYQLSPEIIRNALGASFFYTAFLPGKMFEVLGMDYIVLTSCVLWAIYFFLFKHPFVLLFLYIGIASLDAFFHIIYPGNIRHQGFFYLLLVASLWMAYAGEKKASGGKHSTKLFFMDWLLILIFSLQLIPAYSNARLDWTGEFSSSKKLAHFIRQNTELQQAILISEPDDFAQPLPYYIDNPVYIPREKRFGKTVRLTDANQRDYSLGKWIHDAKTLKHRENRPIVLLLALPLNENGPFEIPIHFGRRLTYTHDSLKTFKKQTSHLASFKNAYYGENYEVFLLR